MDGLELRAGSPSKRREARGGCGVGLKSTPGFHRVFNLWEEVEEITGLSRSLRSLRKLHCWTQTNHRSSKAVI